MKQVTASQRKDGRFEAKGIDPITGARKSYYGKTKEEAESKATGSLQLRDDRTLYGFFANTYRPFVSQRSRGWKDQIAYAMDQFILPVFGHRELAGITRHEIQLAFNRWACITKDDGSPKYKQSSLRKVKIVFSCVMNLALDDELVLKNPVARVRVGGAESRPKRSLSAEELWKLYQASDALCRPVILLAGFCGLRIGECCGVTRKAIDSDAILTVSQQVTQYEGGCRVTETLKTPQSFRMIPLPSDLQTALLNAGQVSDVFVCSDTKGGFITPNNATRSLQAACVRAKIDPISPHILRHTFISLMENDIEAPLRIVEELAGKSKVGNTAAYSHARLEQKRKWMTKFWGRVSMAETKAEETGLRVVSV